ncbi:MAG TPA: site-specific integrase [Bacteroidetes bacterium]|nr:tyrosine recombinase XerC [bacterium BMS3Bbin04]HDO64707.1 site-specific integrase [Bacteroidota bacterium]HEX03832.1 site-specific integrase [Bacteroidota bacterium]
MSTFRSRRAKDGSTIWSVRYMFKGKEHEYSLGKVTKQFTRKRMMEVEISIAEGVDPRSLFNKSASKESEQRTLTFSETIEMHEVYKATAGRNRPSTIVSRKQVLSTIPQSILKKPFKEVTTSDIENWLSKYSQTHKPAGTNLALRYAKSVFNWCLKRGIIDRNVTTPIEQIRIDEKPKYRALSDEQASFLLREVDQDSIFFRTVYIALHFGMRIGEIIQLTWGDVDTDQNQLLVRGAGTKTHMSRAVPAPSPKVIETIMGWARQDSDQVVPYKSIFFASAKFKRIVRAQGWDDTLSFHSTRHTYISNLLKNGAHLSIVSRLAGHSSVAVTDKYYSHFSNGVLSIASAKLNYGAV